MKIFPAIDIKDKKCVRLVKGDFDNKTEYEKSPVEQASQYKDHGFKNLHIVDLDGALTGETANIEIIQEIVSKFDLKIEIGGGVRNFESIKKYTDIGVEKVILGSAAIKDKNFAQLIQENFVGYPAPSLIESEIAESSIRFAYKLKAPGGAVIRKLKDYRNVIIRIEESAGLDESGVPQKCLLISVDIQHYYDPKRPAKDIDISAHYAFAWKHLKSVVIPEFKKKNMEINYE